jgi:acetyl-CoA/propionyl-CoA carboxylase biotin carboxyl carrier protein
VWEETPARIPESVRAALRAAGITAARAIGYDNVGTIECLVAGDDFFFLEMNTRIQVEHTISEEISGIDLVREQICVAAGRPLSFAQSDVVLRGHAIEVRINAEDPAHGFAPAPGTLASYTEPGGFGVRVDSAAFAGMRISGDYDSLIAKLIVRGRSRTETLQRLGRALDEYRVDGVPTTIGLLRALVDFAPVIDASFGTATLEPFAAAWATTAAPEHAAESRAAAGDPATMRVEVNGKLFRVRFVDLPAELAPRVGAPNDAPAARALGTRRARTASGNEISAPMHGVVIEVLVAAGDTVVDGQVVAVIEAMKMMNEIRAHHAGRVAAVHISAGATVEAQTVLITLESAQQEHVPSQS